MRAVRFHPGDGHRIEDLQRPEVGPGDVLLEVGGCGVCHSVLHVMDGDLPLDEPRVLGHEVAIVGIGGLGEFGVQLARTWGCHVVAVDRVPAKLDRAAARSPSRGTRWSAAR